jgi:hypothetical protein
MCAKLDNHHKTVNTAEFFWCFRFLALFFALKRLSDFGKFVIFIARKLLNGIATNKPHRRHLDDSSPLLATVIFYGRVWPVCRAIRTFISPVGFSSDVIQIDGASSIP